MYNESPIREGLRRYPAGLTPAAYALGCAVWQVEPDHQSHKQCFGLLPSFIEAEASGQAHVIEFLYTLRHLHICTSCARMYLDLVRLMPGQVNEESTTPARIPPADLSFLDDPYE